MVQGNLIQTINVIKAQECIDFLLTRPKQEIVGLGMLYGKPGLGKTTFATRTAFRNGYTYLRLEATSTPKTFAKELLASFNEKYRIEIRYREKIQFGIELQLAKQKIDECLKAWSADSNVNLRAIISEAFQVDKKGEIAKYRILRLRRYNIKDQTWKEAMELIDQAIQVVATKQYINFYERDESGQFRQIVLNFPAL